LGRGHGGKDQGRVADRERTAGKGKERERRAGTLTGAAGVGLLQVVVAGVDVEQVARSQRHGSPRVVACAKRYAEGRFHANMG
jgi:hypothetical protein